MTDSVPLRQSGFSWEFENEEALESFFCKHLYLLFQWKILERQYSVNSQRCDLLAIDKNRQLVIIELKNVEDRGIVQQLTRYYDALLEEKPFCSEVNYDKPVHLVAIAPSFHRDNFTNRKYHRLEFKFLQFSVLLENEQFYLSLQDIDKGETWKVEIPYQEPEDNNIPSPPSALLKYLAEFDQQQKERILKIRRKILCFDGQIQEFYSAGSIKYGNGTAKLSKYCAEFLLDRKYGLTLFLWLPYKGGKSKRIGRARIWTDWHKKALIEGYVPTEIGPKINLHKRNIKSLIQALEHELENGQNSIYGDSFYHDENGKEYHYTMMTTKHRSEQYIKEIKNVYRLVEKDALMTYEDAEFISFYKQLIQKKTGFCPSLQPNYKSLNSLLDLALEKWLHRL